MNLRISLDQRSPEAAEARTNAQRLIAAGLGGSEGYESEFNRLFGGTRSVTPESLIEALYLVDALALIARALAVAATVDFSDEDEELQAGLAGVRKDPQQLLAFIDTNLERLLNRTEEP